MAKFRFYALKLTGILILIYLVQLLFNNFTGLFVLNQQSFLQPWRFLTSIFLHGSFTHLIYNCFALALFGSILEKLIGKRKFLIVFFVTGILANLIAVNFYDSALGASGAIFGIIGALIIIRPLLPIWAFGLPMPIFVAGIIWVVGDVIGIFIPSGVGNIAHLSGIFFGLILGFLFRKRISKNKKNVVIINENSFRKWEDGYLGR